MRLNTSGSDENSSSRNGAIKDFRVSKEYIPQHNNSRAELSSSKKMTWTMGTYVIPKRGIR